MELICRFVWVKDSRIFEERLFFKNFLRFHFCIQRKILSFFNHLAQILCILRLGLLIFGRIFCLFGSIMWLKIHSRIEISLGGGAILPLWHVVWLPNSHIFPVICGLELGLQKLLRLHEFKKLLLIYHDKFLVLHCVQAFTLADLSIFI